MPDLPGRTITVDGRSHEVIGVAPSDVILVSDADVLLLLVPFAEDRRGLSNLDVVGRLKPGVSIARAGAEMAALTAQLASEHPDDLAGWGVMLTPLADAVLGPTTPRRLYLLLSAAALLLVVACANLSGLLLVRASARRREMAIRVALGGGRGRIIRQLLVESACLALLGAIGGIALTFAATGALRTTVMAGLPRSGQIAVDIWVLLFACGITALAAAIAGLAPALQASRLDVQRGLRESARAVAGGSHTSRNILIVSQLALSIVLLTSAGLTIRTWAHLRSVDLGFVTDRILTVQIAPRERPEAFVARLLERMAVLPDVERAGATSGAPMSSGNTSLNVYPVGQAIIPTTMSVQADWRTISAGYFDVMNTPFLAGRDFTAADNPSSGKVVIVNQALARSLWGNADPIGREVDLGGGGGTPATVVGLVRDVRAHAPGEAPAASFYMPVYRGLYGPITLVLRTRVGADRLVPIIRAEVRALDPTLPVFDVKTMDELVSTRLGSERLVAGLLTGFAAIATLLAVIGIYSVVSFSTGQRMREVALRLALGARRDQVIRPLLREGVILVAAGVGLGIACSIPAARMMRGLLAGVSPADPVVFASSIGVLAAASLVACSVPATRASRTNPAVVLRAD